MLSLLLIVLSMTFFTACGNEIQPPQVENNTTTTSIPSRMQDESEDTESSGEGVMNEQAKAISLTIADESFIVNLADNSSAEALKELLDEEELTINMGDYGGFEKVGSLGESLPTNDEQITTKLGDVILYQGDKLVIYYDTNSWNFTKLGVIKNTENLKEALGTGEVTVRSEVENNEQKK